MIDRSNALYLAVLAVMSAIFFIYNSVFGFPFLGNMPPIGVSGIPIVIAFIVFGFDAAFACLFAAMLISSFVTGSFIIPSIRFVSTAAMLLVPAAYALALFQISSAMATKQPSQSLKKMLALATIAAATVLGMLIGLFVLMNLASQFLPLDALSVFGIIPVLAVLVVGILVAWGWNDAVGDDIVASHLFTDWKTLGALLSIGVVVRAIIMLSINYFFALPLATSQTPLAATLFLPPAILVGWHVLQGIVDFAGGLLFVKIFSLDEGKF